MNDRGTAELAKKLAGEVLTPNDQAYDTARSVWNARFDRRPDLIVRCVDAGDVQEAVRFARQADLTLGVKSGGHSYAGNSSCDGGLLIDLKPMGAVGIDAKTRTAIVQPGVSWGEFDSAAQALGLATSGGTVSTVGVAGVALGGGEGWLSRKHGLTVDNLTAAEIVTADGSRVRASTETNQDLFWAIRGGGGNFGVVTSFEFALHEVGPELLAGQVIYPGDRAAELLRFFRDYFAVAPDEVSCYAFMLRIPPIPEFPERLHGRLAVDFVLCYSGRLADGEAALAPFRNLGEPIADTIAPTSYVALQQSFDASMGRGNRWYSRGNYLNALTDEAIDAFIGHLEPFPGEFTTAYIGAEGGAIGRVAAEATAFPHRSAAYGMHIFPGWVDPQSDDAVMSWAKRLHAAMAQHTTGGVYVNLLADDEQARVRAAYGGNYDRLARIKKRWDPDNLFRGNHNIEPAA